MPGPIMKASKAAMLNPDAFRKVNGKLRVHNSGGKLIEVAQGTPVYHRGNGRYAPYSRARDAERKSTGGRKKYAPAKDLVGNAGTDKAYRHTSDKSKHKPVKSRVVHHKKTGRKTPRRR